MKTKRPKKEKQAELPITGRMSCQHDHHWDVVDLNPERVTVKCPVCGADTSIRQGFSK